MSPQYQLAASAEKAYYTCTFPDPSLLLYCQAPGDEAILSLLPGWTGGTSIAQVFAARTV